MDRADTEPLISHPLSSPHHGAVNDFVQRYLHQPGRKGRSSWHEGGHRGYGEEHGHEHITITENISDWRRTTRNFLNSRWGHYFILLLVSVDVACIFADFMIEIHTCELRQKQKPVNVGWKMAQETLSVVSLVFSCLFMVELIAATLSFGMSYFTSKFHIFDSLVIVVAFVIDVGLHGVLEEVGSLVVVLRLWRVFKIIEELSAASADSMEKYEEQMEELRRENDHLKRRLRLDLEAGEGEGADEED